MTTSCHRPPHSLDYCGCWALLQPSLYIWAGIHRPIARRTHAHHQTGQSSKLQNRFSSWTHEREGEQINHWPNGTLGSKWGLSCNPHQGMNHTNSSTLECFREHLNLAPGLLFFTYNRHSKFNLSNAWKPPDAQSTVQNSNRHKEIQGNIALCITSYVMWHPTCPRPITSDNCFNGTMKLDVSQWLAEPRVAQHWKGQAPSTQSTFLCLASDNNPCTYQCSAHQIPTCHGLRHNLSSVAEMLKLALNIKNLHPPNNLELFVCFSVLCLQSDFPVEHRLFESVAWLEKLWDGTRYATTGGTAGFPFVVFFTVFPFKFGLRPTIENCRAKKKRVMV